MATDPILDLPMESNDADAATIRDYFKALALAIWSQGEGFSGKRPFGNGGWQHDVYRALVRAGIIAGVVHPLLPGNEWQEIDTTREAEREADEIISEAIDRL